MSAIKKKDLVDRGFIIDRDRNIFNITPDVMYRFDYQINGDDCPVFITLFNGEYCHVVPANNSIKCAFVPIRSMKQIDQLIKVLSGNI